MPRMGTARPLVFVVALVASVGGCGFDSGGGGADAGAQGGDSDSDGDGISDADEGRFEPGGAVDSDGDGTPDYRDEDSDGDGITDADEGAGDFDRDRTPDYRDEDSDGDGIPDQVEGAGAPDTDGDGAPDYRDTDADGDGLPDATEGEPGAAEQPDTDGDGTPDYRDTDSDADGLADGEEGAADSDGDGTPDYADPRNDGLPPPLLLTAISTVFNNPIGIDYHEPTRSVVMSVNYPSGTPSNFERVEADGNHQPFSAFMGMTDEVKIATVRSGNPAGFVAGDLFVGNGVDGEIARITDDGATVISPWVQLPGDGNGLLRGSLHVDRTGLVGGDLVAVTTGGEVWRIASSGAPTLIADVNVHLEGLLVVPDAPVRYGPLAGKIIAGAEDQHLLYAFGLDGSVETYDVGVAVEDIDLVPTSENFFGVNYGTGQLLGAGADSFRAMRGDILLTQEFDTVGIGLFRLVWDGATLASQPIPLAEGSAAVGQWEHVTFARAGIVEIPPID
jgi:hypothetical protein